LNCNPFCFLRLGLLFVLLVSQPDGAIKVSGALDLGAAEELRDALTAATRRGGNVALDLSEAEDCDTACLQLLYSARRTAMAARAEFRVIACSQAVAGAAAAIGLRIEQLTGEGAERASQTAGRDDASGV
jgi:anti-anti-sigma factor